MAIADSLPGVKIEVIVDGSALKEYEEPDAEDNEDEQGTVTRYIEAESAKVFAVSI